MLLTTCELVSVIVEHLLDTLFFLFALILRLMGLV